MRRGSDTIMSDPHLLGTRSSLRKPGHGPPTPASARPRTVGGRCTRSIYSAEALPSNTPPPRGGSRAPTRSVAGWVIFPSRARRGSVPRFGSVAIPPPTGGGGSCAVLDCDVRVSSFSILIWGSSGSRCARSVRASWRPQYERRKESRVFNNLCGIVSVLNVPSGGVGWV